jgi:hypothetical protein
VFNLGYSQTSVSAFKLLVDLKMVVNMDLGRLQFWRDGKLLTEQDGLTGTVHPTIILIARRNALHATIVKSIKSST